MDDQIVEPQYVTVVNRLNQDRQFTGLGRVHAFKAGETRALSQQFAQWLFTRTDGPMLAHTTEGYMHWLGIKDAPQDLADLLPIEMFETSPLTLVDKVENWNTSVLERDEAKTQVKSVPVLRADFEHQGSAGGVSSMGAPSRVLKEK